MNTGPAVVATDTKKLTLNRDSKDGGETGCRPVHRLWRMRRQLPEARADASEPRIVLLDGNNALKERRSL